MNSSQPTNKTVIIPVQTPDAQEHNESAVIAYGAFAVCGAAVTCILFSVILLIVEMAKHGPR